MKHVIRWAWNLTALLSLLLCPVTCTLWARSRSVCDVAFEIDAQGNQWALCSVDGVLAVTETAATVSGLAGRPRPAQPWQHVRAAAPQAAYYQWQPAPGDAVWGGRAVMLMARAQPIYAPGGYSGFQPPAPVTSTAILGFSLRDWLLATLTAILPLARAAGWYARRRRARSANRGNCANCGYDLTGNISGRCPECGTASAVTGFPRTGRPPAAAAESPSH